jgi:thioredoxin reductase (NADPH)
MLTDVDVAIVGAGPIGLEMAVALKHAAVSYAHFEAGQIGSTFQWWAPGTRFFSSPERIEIAGVPMALTHQDKATREEYLSYLRAVARQFDLPIRTYTRVTRIQGEHDRFVIESTPSSHGVGGPEEIAAHHALRPDSAAPSSPSGAVRSHHLILTMGDMHRPRLLGIPGEELPHVSHYLADPHAYFKQRVLVVGGKNSAVEAALRLYRVGASVTISYRGDTFDPKRVKYWLRPELEWLISKSRIAFRPRTTVKSIQCERVELQSDSGSVTNIEADLVLLLTGYVQDPQLFQQLGIELEGEELAPKFALHTMQTNIPNVFVAGTAAGGSQRRARLFIENSHIHVRRILKTIAQRDVPWPTDRDFGELEQ